MSKFFYPVNLLSEKSEIHFRELSYKAFKDINKAIIGGDNHSLCLFLDDLLQELCIEPINFRQLSAFDKFYILAFLYGTNVSTSIQFTLTCPVTKKPFNYMLDLVSIMDKIEKLDLKPIFKKKLQHIEYGFTFPHEFARLDTEEKIFLSSFQHIVVESKKYPAFTFIHDDKVKLVNQLPGPIIRSVRNWLIGQNNALGTIDFLGVQSPHTTDPAFIKFVPSLFDSSLLEFIKCLYRDDLTAIYRQEYNLVRNFGFSFDSFNDITPAEVSIYDGMEREKAKKQAALPSKPRV